MVDIYRTGTEYVANEVTMLRGVVGDITSTGVYLSLDPNTVPTVAEFTAVPLVLPTDPLGEAGKNDVLTLVGPRDGDVGSPDGLPPGDYQQFILVTTAAEDIIRKTGVVTIL